jgi:hypothetical protein
MSQSDRPVKKLPGEGRDAISRKVTGFKASLYSHIHVSVRVMNIIIAVLATLLAIAIIAGIAMGKP